MATLSSGLIVTPQLTQRNVKVDLHFQPSVGILARKVDKLGLDIRSFREPLQRAVKNVMIPSIRQNFLVGGRPQWESLLDDTIKQKGGDSRPLIRTGSLMRVMGQQNVWTIDTEKAMITDLPQKVWYGKVHQAGHGGEGGFEPFFDEVKGKKVNIGEGGAIPARPFVVVQPEDIQDIEEVFQDWLGERIRMAGL